MKIYESTPSEANLHGALQILQSAWRGGKKQSRNKNGFSLLLERIVGA
jgi:hypothetical protein